VELDRPHAGFPAIAATPLFGVVPPSAWRDDQGDFGPNAVVSGAYQLSAVTASEITFKANARYWAGKPAIDTVHLVLDIGGRDPITTFASGELDYTQVSQIDALWLPYDPGLGSKLRFIQDLDTTYLGFDTRRKPFDDVRVRQAFGAAVDWARVAALAALPTEIPAAAMVPPGIPGRSSSSWLPAHDPEHARRLLADAGYPGGKGFPDVAFATGFSALGSGIAAQLEQELGVKVRLETIADHYERLLGDDSPGMWIVSWIADYPGANDFLGVLLGSKGSSNYGGWATPAFDAAIADALSATDPAAAQAAFDRAEAEVQRDVPTVPLVYDSTYALSAEGLLGAGENGLGLQRWGGMSWAR
jgi:ABC-type oligopeptide transport system substrate-binding subunit